MTERCPSRGIDRMSPECPICGTEPTPSLQRDGCQYYICGGCGFLFARPDEPERTVTYDATYWAMERDEAARRERQDAFVRALELIYLSNVPVQRVLDFGCGQGVTVRMLRAGLGLDVVGADPYGEFEPCDYLLRLDAAQLASVYPVGYFDVIYSIEVFEHLADPVGVIRSLLQLLRPAGKLLINTGTREFLEQYDPEMHYLDPLVRGHISIYSLGSFQAMAGKFGATVGFMADRRYAVIVEKPSEAVPSLFPLEENLQALERLGPWMPMLFREYMRLVELEREFVKRSEWALRLDAELRRRTDASK